MPEQALYLKWRPQTFDDVVGQEHVTRTLRNSLKRERIRHAYLFSGQRGTGKTTMARLLAKAVNCHDPDPERRPCNECPACIAVNEGRYLDLIEIDAATHTGVDDVRDLRDKIAFSPGEGRYKVYIIDEVHRFTGNAFDALLKTLEEPPEHALFVLATTEIDKVPPTIKSRCLQFEFRRLSLPEVSERLALIADSEHLQIEQGALEMIARQGGGSVRDSISLLDQIVADPEEAITLELVQRILGTASVRAVRELVEALVTRNTGLGLHIINGAVDSGSDPRQFGQQVVEHLRAVLLAQTASADLVEASQEDRALYQEQAAQLGRGDLLRAIRGFNEAVNSYKGGWQPQLSLELALIESLRAPDDDPITPSAPRSQPEQRPVPAEEQSTVLDPVEPTPEGAPPLIEVSLLRERWLDVKKAVARLNRNLPALLDHADISKVDGNRLIIGVPNPFFLEKLAAPDRLEQIERAIYEVHQAQLRVQIVLVEGHSESAVGGPSQVDLDEDDLLRFGIEELGGEIGPDEDAP
ncbi:MAG TPA: DNA polymerase III subunit gamma/tau [Candidatus Tectomicrobia bacterium]